MKDLSNGQYSNNKNTKFKTLMLRSDLCDYSDANIAVKGTIKLRKILHLKIMLHLEHAYQKLTVH